MKFKNKSFSFHLCIPKHTKSIFMSSGRNWKMKNHAVQSNQQAQYCYEMGYLYHVEFANLLVKSCETHFKWSDCLYEKLSISCLQSFGKLYSPVFGSDLKMRFARLTYLDVTQLHEFNFLVPNSKIILYLELVKFKIEHLRRLQQSYLNFKSIIIRHVI